jgi:hypothetical protein
MELEDIFENMWVQYKLENPIVDKIHTLIETKERGAEIINDHIALRTFNHPKINLEVLAKFFINRGYEERGQYLFADKNLVAKHYEKEGYPRVFISELTMQRFSMQFNETINKLIDQIPASSLETAKFLWSGTLWDTIDTETYEELRKESEYGAWLATFGFRANHFTVSVNDLRCFEIDSLNRFLKNNEVQMNTAGGEIKGDKFKDKLQQSSTLASVIPVMFSDKTMEVPCCYYEFAQRYELEDGNLFSGFIANSADKIFESTDVQ